MHRLILGLILLALAAPLNAQCRGQNLIDALPSQTRIAIMTAANAVPHSKGNLWRATRDNKTVYLVGTFHMNDPRHDALMQTLTPLLASAKTLLVEAGPAEEEALRQKMAADPTSMIDKQGSDLADHLTPDEWRKLTDALLQRAIPSSISAKLRPWFVSLLLAIPPCALPSMAEGGGLDKRLLAEAQARDIPVTAMEPFDTALRLFDDLTLDDQIMMIRNALLVEDRAADYLKTTADAFFAEESRLIWEFNRLVAADLPGTTPEQIANDFAQMEEALMASRNRDWINIIESAAEKGPALAAFGALHLSGPDGVVSLLQRGGWQVERLPI